MEKFKSFRTLFLGRSGSGKTTLMYERIKYIVKQGWINPNRIVLFSLTAKSDPVVKKYIRDIGITNVKQYMKTNVSENIQLDFINYLYNSNKALADQGKTYYEWLLVMDDQISEKAVLKSNDLNKTFTSARHYKINAMFSMQAFKNNLIPEYRDQFTEVCIFQMNSATKVIDILKDFSNKPNELPKEGIKQVYFWYGQAIRSRNGHGALRIRTDVSYGDGRYDQNYEEKYFDVEKIDEKKADSESDNQPPKPTNRQRNDVGKVHIASPGPKIVDEKIKRNFRRNVLRAIYGSKRQIKSNY